MRKATVTFLNGNSQDLELSDEDFRVIMRGVQLFFLTTGTVSSLGSDRRRSWSFASEDVVSLMLQAEFGMGRSEVRGFVEIAQAIYVSEGMITVLEYVKDDNRQIGRQL